MEEGLKKLRSFIVYLEGKLKETRKERGYTAQCLVSRPDYYLLRKKAHYPKVPGKDER